MKEIDHDEGWTTPAPRNPSEFGRFNPIFTGYRWYIVDKLTQNWYPANDKAQAEYKARALSYESDEMYASRESFERS